MSEIPLAEEREQQAIEKANAVFDAARDLLATGMLQAVGYRVLIKPIEAIKTLEAVEVEKYPTLAAAGVETKSEGQKKREDRGSNHGVVIHMGPKAFDRLGGPEAWCDVGDTVVFTHYAGTRVEHPPGSEVFYQIMNDEDVFGKVI